MLGKVLQKLTQIAKSAERPPECAPELKKVARYPKQVTQRHPKVDILDDSGTQKTSLFVMNYVLKGRAVQGGGIVTM